MNHFTTPVPQEKQALIRTIARLVLLLGVFLHVGCPSYQEQTDGPGGEYPWTTDTPPQDQHEHSTDDHRADELGEAADIDHSGGDLPWSEGSSSLEQDSTTDEAISTAVRHRSPTQAAATPDNTKAGEDDGPGGPPPVEPGTEKPPASQQPDSNETSD